MHSRLRPVGLANLRRVKFGWRHAPEIMLPHEDQSRGLELPLLSKERAAQADDQRAAQSKIQSGRIPITKTLSRQERRRKYGEGKLAVGLAHGRDHQSTIVYGSTCARQICFTPSSASPR